MSENFFEEMNGVFKDILEDKNKILIVDASTGKPIEGVRYDQMFFDSALNMYKTNAEGKIVRITNSKVKAILKG